MARPRRPREPRKPRAPRVAGTYQTTAGAAGGGELVQAAEEIADGARENAQSWAKTGATVRSVHTEQQDEKSVLVVADSGAAYPAETRSRHPLFGDRKHWYGPPGSAFLRPALDARSGRAMAKYAKKIDVMCRERGWK